MSADDLETDLTRDTEGAPRKLLTRSFFFLCMALSVVTTLSIVGLLVSETVKLFTLTAPLIGVVEEMASIVDFLTGTTWQVYSQEFGVLALVSTTLMATIRSAIIALPLGVATAIYPSEYASTQARSILKPALKALAGVPIIVYDFFVLIYIMPVLEVVFPGIGTLNMLSASIVIGVMIIPTVASISEDAISTVSDELRQAGYGMGTAKFDVSTGIVVPAVLSGTFSSFILALFRTIGETVAIIVTADIQVRFLNLLNPASYLKDALPMTAAIVQLLTGDITGSGLVYRGLFAIGLVLFIIMLVTNVISDCASRRYQETY